MKKQEIYKLIESFLKGKASKKEEQYLKDFLDSYQSGDLDWKPEYGDHFQIEERLYKNIKRKLGESHKPKVLSLRNYQYLKYASVVILALGIASFYFIKNQFDKIEVENSIVTSKEDSKSDHIILKLADGTSKIIDVNEDNTIKNANGNVVGVQRQGKITYSNVTEADEGKIVFNELYVPYGKKFKIELYDGTLVTMNSGSSLKYPVKFLKGLSREVFLEGEAYFDVSKSKEQSFKVHANTLVTEVYGTEFNISSYKNEDRQEVVLVEGSVGVTNTASKKESEVILKPSIKASLFNNETEIRTTQVQVENYIAWKDNVLLFNNLKFESIIKKLERHYNVSITNTNVDLNSNRYTGTFETETIEQVLTYLSKVRPFTFKIEGNRIIINS